MSQVDINVGNNTVQVNHEAKVPQGALSCISISCGPRSGLFILIGKNINGPYSRVKDPGKLVWKYVDRSPMKKYIPIDSTTFRGFIMDLVNR